jgi:hypothetical protein
MSRISSPIRIRPLQAAAILATLFAAAVHIYLAVAPTSPQPQLRTLFWLAALGYLGAGTAVYAPLTFLDPLRWLARLALIGVTLSTIVAYFIVTGFVFDMLALSDKLVEALLVVLLVADGLAARNARQPGDIERESARRAAAQVLLASESRRLSSTSGMDGSLRGPSRIVPRQNSAVPSSVLHVVGTRWG